MKIKLLTSTVRPIRKTKKIHANEINENTKIKLLETLNRDEQHQKDQNENIDEKWSKLRSQIHKSVESSIGCKYGRVNKKKIIPWCDKDVRKAVRNRRHENRADYDEN